MCIYVCVCVCVCFLKIIMIFFVLVLWKKLLFFFIQEKITLSYLFITNCAKHYKVHSFLFEKYDLPELFFTHHHLPLSHYHIETIETLTNYKYKIQPKFRNYV